MSLDRRQVTRLHRLFSSRLLACALVVGGAAWLASREIVRGRDEAMPLGDVEDAAARDIDAIRAEAPALGAAPWSPEREALARARAARSEAALVTALDAPDPLDRSEARVEVRRARIGSEEAVASLLVRARGDDDEEAAASLRTLGAVAGDRRDVLDLLSDTVLHAAPPRTRAAAAGLVLAGSGGVDRLRAALADDPSALDALRGVVVRTVSDGEFERTSNALVPMLEDPRPAARAFALRSLDSSRPQAPEATRALLQLLRSPTGRTDERRLAIEALARGGAKEPEVSEAIRAACSDPDELVAAAARRECAALAEPAR